MHAFLEQQTLYYSQVNMENSPWYHMLSHQVNFSKFRKLELMPNIIFCHNEMNLEINNKRNTQILLVCKMQSKHQTTSRSKKTLMGTSKYFETNKNSTHCSLLYAKPCQSNIYPIIKILTSVPDRLCQLPGEE